MNQYYSFDKLRRVWLAPVDELFPYSDGEDSENYLLSVLKSAKDVSSTSSEMLNAIRDWPSEYHLSPVRHNLLRPFKIKATDRILELGCGCGSITRYLGETGATVFAVEGSLRRAEIAAERCRDLPNVTVFCDNLADFKCDEKFDYVTLIGVLEYSPLFINGGDPVVAGLVKARSHLKEEGGLILAIENQLGLKYFNGCSEDHVGVPYYGVSGLYESNEPVTFGRYNLTNKLKESGFSGVDLFFPYPDYKLPNVILSEAALEESRFNFPDLLMNNFSRDYQGGSSRAFPEGVAWRVVAENKLAMDLANSFLVFARNDKFTDFSVGWLAKIFSRGVRNFCYQVSTTIALNKNAELVVLKEKLYPGMPVPGEFFSQVVDSGVYHEGKLLLGRVHKAMAREVALDELAACFAPWLNYLLSHASPGEGGKSLLPNNFVDCIPGNLIEGSLGELYYFDAEWVSAEPIPMAWVIVRGINNSFSGCIENRSIKGFSYREIITLIAQRSGIKLTEKDFESADEFEARLALQCHADAAGKTSLLAFIDEEPFLTCRLFEDVSGLKRELIWCKKELARVKHTFSWRATAPLRVVWNIYLKLKLGIAGLL